MQFIIPFCHKDAWLAEKLCAWIGELGGLSPTHRCLLLAAKATPANLRVPVLNQAKQSLGCPVEMAETSTSNEKGWPESCNHLFYCAAAKMKRENKPFLWLEPDCTPMRASWLGEIESEYLSSKKPFMGFIYDKPWPHLTGCAVYPADIGKYNLASLSPAMNGKNPLPWDTVAAQSTLKHTHQTKLIYHEWERDGKSPEFLTPEDISTIPKNTAIFHRCKNGSLIDRLRENAAKPSVVSRIANAIKSFSSDILDKPPVPYKDLSRSIAIAYLYPCDARETFMQFAVRWAESYKRFAPKIKHDVIVFMSNGIPNEADYAVFKDIPASFNVGYNGGGWDIGHFQYIAKVCNHDLVVFMNSRAYLWRDGWLERFVEAVDRFGPDGLYGIMASYEACCIPNTFPAPNPHIRTSCFVANPKVLRQFPYEVDSREQSFKFESGEWNVSDWYANNGLPVKLVTADGFYDRPDWRKPPNIFRRGDQSNCLTADRHTLIYATASESEKRELSARSDGGWPRLAIHPIKNIGPKQLTGHKTITVVAATSLNPEGHAKAIEWTASLIPHPCEKLLISPKIVPGFSGKQLPLPEPWAKDGKWSMNDMSDFMLNGLHKYINTDVAIVVHDDGYALNRSKWTNDFLNYDYIGAPWPSKFPWTKPENRVGNGGFSLRSRRWLQHASKLLKMAPGTSEDVYCGITNARHFIKAGYRIAPLGVAMRWSFEHTVEEFPDWKLTDSFGFHGLTAKVPIRKHLRL